MDCLNLAKEVSCKKKYIWKNKKNKNYKIAAIDYGIKYIILNLLYKEDCSITIFPSDVSFDESANLTILPCLIRTNSFYILSTLT